MIDCLIIHPGEASTIYGGLANELTAIETPLWPRIIAGFLRDTGFSAKILDMDAGRLPPTAAAIAVNTYHPRLVALVAWGNQPSASTQSMTGVHAIAEALKDIDVDTIIIGPHVSALPVRSLCEEPVTYICDGEGPLTIQGLLNKVALEIVPGLVWRRDGKIICNKPARLLNAETEMEGDTWDLLDMTAYRAHPWQCFGDFSGRSPYASIYTSFGCPFKCGFCMINSPFHSHRYRVRTAENVVNQIDALYQTYGVKTFKFADEMFVLRPGHYENICTRLIDYGLGGKINIWAYARVDTVKPEKLEMLRMAGVRWLALGIESGSEYVRDGSQKALRNNDIVGVVRQVQAAGINVIGNFIFGLPYDNIGSMRATLDLALETRCEFANFYSAMAYPGSKLYEQAVASGASLPEKWSGYSQHSFDCLPLGSENLSPAQVLKFRDEAFQTYFRDPGYLSMVGNKFGAETRDYVESMAAHPLPRKILEPV